MNTLFSIIIPTLNEEKYLPKLLDDLIKQTFHNFEVIVVDGQSEDQTLRKTEKIANKLPKITIIQTITRNVSYQRNLGAKIAKGKYFIFFDADNRISPNFLNDLSLQLQDQKPDVFTTWCVPDSNRKRDKAVTILINLMVETAEALDTGAALGAMIGCKKESFQKTSGFNINTLYAEDGEFVRAVIKSGGIFQVFRNPTFTWSFRRFKKEGTIKQLRQHTLLHLKKITNPNSMKKENYPMGGHLYTDNKSSNLLLHLNQTMEKIIKNPATLKKIRTTLKKLETLR